MSFVITKLTEDDLQSIDELSRRYRNTVGFFTMETFRDYLIKGGVIGARTDQGQLVGYLLFAENPDRFRIAQLCVLDSFRGQGLARKLFEALKARASTQKLIKLRCRRDFSANEMWPKLGFIPFDEKPGRSAEGHLLTSWIYRLAQDDELGLWKARNSEESTDIVIDAQIFYDFDAPETPNSLISKGLLHDSLIDTLNIWITDELFAEIDRQPCNLTRRRSREKAHGMARLISINDQVEQYKNALKGILPYKTPSEQSDVHHLAKTAASSVKTFATKDEKLLKKAQEIKTLIGVSVIHPAKIITSLHELSDKHTYSPDRVCGLNLFWSRMKDEDCAELSNNSFQEHGETKGKLIEIIRSYLVYPNKYHCDILKSQSRIVAIRVYEVTDHAKLVVHLTRVFALADTKLFCDFIIADILSRSVESKCQIVEFSSRAAVVYLRPSLIEMGFMSVGDAWARLTVVFSAPRDQIQDNISKFSTDLETQYRNMSDHDFERSCAPLLSIESIPTYIIPIKPAFAMGLLDRRQAADDLFGGNPSVLLRWENVYYKKKSHYKILRHPGRILWYVSGSVGALIAISHLDMVDIGYPKELFQKYKKFGVLEWRDIYSMCGKDVDEPIMAIRFSRTFLFKQSVDYKTLKAILSESDIGGTFQSPVKIPFHTCKKLYEIGFEINK